MKDITFKDILLHSPYERLLSYGLKESEFRQYLLVRNETYSRIADDIIKSFEISDNNKSFYFLKGFSGCGKTTFIRWFIKEVIDYKNNDIKANEIVVYREYINLSFESDRESGHLTDKIKEIIEENFKEYKSTFVFIEENFSKISNAFPGIKDKESFISDITTASENNPFFKESLKKVIDLPLRTLILICLLQKIITVLNENKICFFCIDNLDSLDFDYLIEDFWKDFFFSFNKLVDIQNSLGWDFDIKKKLKVLFVLREHNYNLIKANFNKHASDILRPLTHDVFNIVQPDLRSILEKRATYAISNGIDVNSNILKVIKLILEEDSYYRDKLYLPLFNYDLRKINQKIIEIATNESLIHFKFDFDIYKKLFNHKESRLRNGARGIILHAFLKILFGSEEKYPIDPIFDDGTEDTTSTPAYCSYCRMLITVIYNLTCPNGKRFNRWLDNLHEITREHFTLDKLILALRVNNNPKESIIPYKNVFYWINKFYNIRNETITHMINISDKTSFKNKSISYEDEVLESSTIDHEGLAESSLGKISVRINPSGVVYLRYIIPHFEYFSMYKYWKGGDSDSVFSVRFKPLYLSTSFIASDNKFEFEILLEDVLKLFEKKKRRNDKFLQENIMKMTNINSIEKFLSSKFAFHLKDINSQLYSSRVITTHLRYIESFRKYLLDDKTFNNYVLSCRKYNHKCKSIIELNNFILEIQQKYVCLFFENEQLEIFDYSINEVMKNWKTHISILKSGGHSNWTGYEE